ncbi:MAG: capsular biosynthesis protein [Pseudomonadota bacterium]
MSETPSATVGCYALRQLLSHSRILLLQGPVGPFFSHLANFLDSSGHTVFKIHFNGGDDFFYRRQPAEHYTGTPEEWAGWVERYISDHRIQAIALFGEWRHYHREAWHVADRLGVAVYVFEEGYLRPDYITLERHGVNGNSLTSRNPEDYRSLPMPPRPEPRPVDHRFYRAAAYAMAYYLAAFFRRRRYPAYQHHRPLNPLTEGGAWLRSGWRKKMFALTERRTLRWLASPSMHKRFFLVPLQVHNDSQVRFHSRFESVEAFIREVVESFACDAPRECSLVLKHHPMDRGYTNYTRLIRELADQHGLGDRLIYVHDGHLPTLQKQALGVVTINSTVGLSAFFHKAPVKILGEAVYDVPGLVSTKPLDEFWQDPGEVDEALFVRFKRELIRTTQLNAGFYTPTSYRYAFDCTRQQSAEKPLCLVVSGGDN